MSFDLYRIINVWRLRKHFIQFNKRCAFSHDCNGDGHLMLALGHIGDPIGKAIDEGGDRHSKPVDLGFGAKWQGVQKGAIRRQIDDALSVHANRDLSRCVIVIRKGAVQGSEDRGQRRIVPDIEAIGKAVPKLLERRPTLRRACIAIGLRQTATRQQHQPVIDDVRLDRRELATGHWRLIGVLRLGEYG